MGKGYEPPITQELVNEIVTTAKASKEAAAKAEAPQEMTLATIYKKQLDNFDLFVKGKYATNSVEARHKAMIDFIKLFDTILNSEYSVAKPVLHHFIHNVNKSLRVYQNGDMFAPIYAMKKIPYNIKVNRFIELICFLVGLAENIQSARKYVSGRDIAYILRDYSAKQKATAFQFINNIG